MHPNSSTKPSAGHFGAGDSPGTSDAGVTTAALWFAKNRDSMEGAFIPELQRRFGLTPMQAIEAAKLAYEIEQGGNHVSCL